MKVSGVVVLGVIASAAGVGCGTNQDCSVTPPLAQAPASCSATASSTLSMTVHWCDCNAGAIGCKVTPEQGGVIQVEPVLQACDASCPSNPTSCGAANSGCSVPVPSATGSYHIYVFGAQNALGYEDVPLTVGAGGSGTCSGG